jgi:hypothetical protein
MKMKMPRVKAVVVNAKLRNWIFVPIETDVWASWSTSLSRRVCARVLRAT